MRDCFAPHCKNLRLPDHETYFVAGLFHDLGKVFLDTYFHDRYAEVCESLEQDPRPTYLVEKELLEIDHAEVGGLLASRWKFPEILVTPIACHHSLKPIKKQYLPITLGVDLANFLIKKADLGLVYETNTPDTSNLLKAHLKITTDQLKAVYKSLVDEQDRIFEFMHSIAA